MKLQDEFKGLVYPYLGSGMLINESDESVIETNSKICEKVAENFAIGFVEWLNYKSYRAYSNGWANFETKVVKENELLQIYKKEKGL